MESAFFGVIIPAAGSATRFGSDKLMLELCGKPVLWHTVAAFQAAQTVSSIVIPTRPENVLAVRQLTAEFSKVVAVIAGGSSRQESVSFGLHCLPDEVDYVSIHDAARPLILPEEIDRLHTAALEYGSVCAALPVYDTIQQVDRDGYILSTPNREFLLAAATPQIFPINVYWGACLDGRGKTYTDDAGMVRDAGARVKMILCQGENFKITTKEDAFRAQQVLLRRQGF